MRKVGKDRGPRIYIGIKLKLSVRHGQSIRIHCPAIRLHSIRSPLISAVMVYVVFPFDWTLIPSSVQLVNQLSKLLWRVYVVEQFIRFIMVYLVIYLVIYLVKAVEHSFGNYYTRMFMFNAGLEYQDITIARLLMRWPDSRFKSPQLQVLNINFD